MLGERPPWTQNTLLSLILVYFIPLTVITDNGSKTEVVEDIREYSPHRRAGIFSAALIVESVDLCDLPCLVIPSDQMDPVGVSYFQGKEQ